MNAVLLVGCVFAAHADVIWNNGAPVSDGHHCDTNNSLCNGNGWTVADDFTLAAGTIVSGFTYDDYIFSGGAGDYAGTAWNIWNGDPFLGGSVIASGLTIGSVVSGTTETVTVTGLNVPLGPGTYWLGIETQENNDGLWTRAISSGSGDYEQWDGPTNNGGASFQFNVAGETAFTVLGAPEPGTAGLMAFGLLGAATALVRRRRAQASR